MSRILQLAAMAAIPFMAADTGDGGGGAAIATPPAPAKPNQVQNELLHIPLDKIRTNPVALRDVQKNDQGFTEMVDSIRSYGVMNAINVRRKPGQDGKEFELVDGLQRFSASQEVGLQTIPAQVINVEEADQIVAQVIGNAVRLDTKPVEYAKALMKILGYNPTWTETELAAKINKSPTWVSKQLGLLRLHDQIKPLVNEGKIPAANAYVLAKLPQDEQLDWLSRAQTTDANQFTQQVLERAKQIKEANRKGQDAGEEQFVATYHLRKKPEIEEQIKSPDVLKALIASLKIDQAKSKMEAALGGAVLALQWVGQTDPQTLQGRKQKWEETKAKQAQDKIRREAEKTAKREKEATDRAAKARDAAAAAAKAAAALPPAAAALPPAAAEPAPV